MYNKMYSVNYPMIQTLFPQRLIGRMAYLDTSYMFYWVASSNQVLIRKQFDDNVSWILQPDANIADSLAALMDCAADRILIQKYDLTNGPILHGDREKFLECAWSDYAVDDMCVSFVCRVISESRCSDE